MWEVLKTAAITFFIMFLLHHIYDHLQHVLSAPVVEVKRKEEYAKIDQLIKPDMKEELADFIQQLHR